jgi:transcription elongation factor Elf1
MKPVNCLQCNKNNWTLEKEIDGSTKSLTAICTNCGSKLHYWYE